MNSHGFFNWFDFSEQDAYLSWRKKKLSLYPITLDQLYVEVPNADLASEEEIQRMRYLLARYNMVLYRTPDLSENRKIPLQICAHLGLHTLDRNRGAGKDAITEIRVRETGLHGRYIPYTTSQLSWHTDGYYNPPDLQIRAMALHCVRPAISGGENELLDIEMAYLYLRDLDPEFVRVLSLPDVMTIPANEVDGKILRAAQRGPVFSEDLGGNLHMRYTARKRNIQWKNTPLVEAAVQALESLFDKDRAWIMRSTLAAGEGLICNNILHNRRGFQNVSDAPRLLYRLRYYERVGSLQRKQCEL